MPQLSDLRAHTLILSHDPVGPWADLLWAGLARAGRSGLAHPQGWGLSLDSCGSWASSPRDRSSSRGLAQAGSRGGGRPPSSKRGQASGSFCLSLFESDLLLLLGPKQVARPESAWVGMTQGPYCPQFPQEVRDA